MSPIAEWPVTFFDEDYLKIYRPQITLERTLLEVDFIDTTLGLAKGAEILDLACGSGRHAIGMASRGYRVTGVDFNPRYLEIAAVEAERAGAEATWMVGDMRTLNFDGAFDGVYSYFTSFGYFSDEVNEQVLSNIVRALRPGGRFLLDMANRERLLTRPQQRSWTQQEDGSLLMEEATLDLLTSRVTSRLMLIRPQEGVQVTKEFNLRVYTCAELTALFTGHDLEVKGVWGGPDRSVYSADSVRLILLGERKVEGLAGAAR